MIEENDYILKPHENGYIGLNENFKIDSYNVEFQIKTKSMNQAQEITHDGIYKGSLPSELKDKVNKVIFEHYTREDANEYRILYKEYMLKQNPKIKSLA